jgi:hypothetical protein
MAIKVNVVKGLINSLAGTRMFHVKDFLKSILGWTVAGSGDGTTGAMDGVDRVTTTALMSNLWSWVVLQSPHTVAGDRIQLLFSRNNNVNASSGYFEYAPNTSYTGGGASSIPTATNSAVVFIANIGETGSGAISALRLVGDTEEPFGWAAFEYRTPFDPTFISWGSAFVPLEEQPEDPGKPYWFYVSLSGSAFSITGGVVDVSNQGSGSSVSRGMAETQSPPNTPTNVPATVQRAGIGSTLVIPTAIGLDSTDRHISLPVLFASSGGLTGRYIGRSTFMRWDGTTRSPLTTFNNKTRITFGTVNFPWDGVTVP